MTSTITGEEKTFHFALATGRYKDNRIPPRGYQYQIAGTRLSEPVWQGVSATNLFTHEEYTGGYRHVNLQLPTGATQMTVRLYYQTTSREYIEFLRDEINGTNGTLTGTGAGGDPAYIVQTDAWFAKLKAWGNTMWQLWENNKDLPGAAPILMTSASVSAEPLPSMVTLTFISDHGNFYPSGTVTQFVNTSVTGTINHLITDGATQYVNTGWRLAGNDPVTGTGQTAVITLTNNAVLTWTWATNYWLVAVAEGFGVTSITGEWMAADSVVSVTAAASNHYHFSHWTGQVDSGQEQDNPVAILMDQARVIAAVFVETLATNNVPEWWLAIYYPEATNMNELALSDSDLDGIQAWAEYIAGTNPTDADSVLALHQVAENGLAITWPSVSGRLYSVMYATNLAEAFHPFPDALALPATPNFNAYTNLTATNVPMLLYRIDVQRETPP